MVRHLIKCILMFQRQKYENSLHYVNITLESSASLPLLSRHITTPLLRAKLMYRFECSVQAEFGPAISLTIQDNRTISCFPLLKKGKHSPTLLSAPLFTRLDQRSDGLQPLSCWFTRQDQRSDGLHQLFCLNKQNTALLARCFIDPSAHSSLRTGDTQSTRPDERTSDI